jgi:DNA-binding transcriptional LysR family regulator
MEQQSFGDNSETIFARRGAKVGAAAHRYCEQLLELMKGSKDIVKTFIQSMSAHGLRKGSATHVASATAVPPPIASIASRGRLVTWESS